MTVLLIGTAVLCAGCSGGKAPRPTDGNPVVVTVEAVPDAAVPDAAAPDAAMKTRPAQVDASAQSAAMKRWRRMR